MIITSSGDDAPLPLTQCPDAEGDAFDAAERYQVPKSDAYALSVYPAPLAKPPLALMCIEDLRPEGDRAMVRTLDRAVPIARTAPQPSRTDVESDMSVDGLEALRQAAQRAEARQWQSLGLRQRVKTQPGVPLLALHADPLSPLRERDLNALTLLFHRDDMHHIEADVTRQLLRLWPEPCWEDDPLDFLTEFL